MRVVCVFFALVGGCSLVAGTAIELAEGHPADVAWCLLVSPLLVAGLLGVLYARGSGRRVAAWLLVCGALTVADACLGNALGDVPGLSGSSWAWELSLLEDIIGNLSVVGGIGLIGLFPAGRPETRTERVVLGGAAAMAVAVPVLSMVAFPSPPDGLFEPAQPDALSPLYRPGASLLQPVVNGLRYTFAVWVIFGLVLLWLRYLRGSAADRRVIRWLLVVIATAFVVFGVLTALSLLATGPAVTVTVLGLWGVALILVLASLAGALFTGGMLAIDETTSRTFAYRTLWVLIAVAYVSAATGLGVLVSGHLPGWAAMLLAAAAALAFQPAQRHLEHLADRWVFGRRLDGYQVITRFGALLESALGPDDLLARLSAAIREGLAVSWARVRLDLAPATLTAPAWPADRSGDGDVIGTAEPAGPPDQADRAGHPAAPGTGPDGAGEPACVVPLIHGDRVLGQIECGPRRDGPLLDEDRRLLAHVAAQAATAVSNVRLTAELADRVAVIEQQAAELTASRARLVKSTDDERRRIQRDLHDGPQQDLVVLNLNLTLARERLRRGDPRADATLAEMQADLVGLLDRLREFAHAIHPPVLADQGLLVAIEAQASRLPLEVMIEADAELRGVRYPEQIETAAWYAVSEAVTNAVKHACATRLRIGLVQAGRQLSVEVGDDGRGFDPGAARGLGLTGLADRMAIVHGELRVRSQPGRGSTVQVCIPLPVAAQPVGAQPVAAQPAAAVPAQAAGSRESGAPAGHVPAGAPAAAVTGAGHG
jgi:signal transduction histidine kinase